MLKREDVTDNLFAPQILPSLFTIRTTKDYEDTNYVYERQFLKRVNGELTVFNTIKIIKSTNPDISLLRTRLMVKFGNILKMS
ncbi:hypothetical protein EfsSVR2281_11710 [Enterococcus faecalis]|nr:hypothetical protein EfsSVR2281_11710 [Enterococcus faecalis]